jgi:hypothetical protein
MAKQRINPEATPDRLFQPVASPVDLYFRPALDSTGIAQNAQIIQALQDFSPQLQRLTSDLVAQNIDRETAEAADAINQGSLEEALGKATKAIEKGGGLAPWRLQSTLTEYGRRATREVYQAAVYKEWDNLTRVTKEDGTLVTSQEQLAKLDELFKSMNLPEDSYYINRGAAAERARIDSAVIPKMQAKYAENLKQRNSNDLEDRLFSTLNYTSPADILENVIGDSFGGFGKLMDEYYALYGESGSDEAVSAVVKWTEGQRADSQYDEVIDVLNGMIDLETGAVSIAGRQLGARQSAVLKTVLQETYKERESEAVRNSVTAEQETAKLRRRVSSAYRLQLSEKLQAQQEAGRSPTLSMSIGETRKMAETLLRDAGADEDQVTENLGIVIDEIRSYVDSVNSPRPSDPQYFQDVKQGILMGMSQDQTLDAIRRGTVTQALSPQDASTLESLAAQYTASEKIVPGFITNNPEMVKAQAELQNSLFEDLTGEGENSLLMVPSDPVVASRVRRFLRGRIQEEMLAEYKSLTKDGIPSALAAEHIRAEMNSRLEDVRIRVMEQLTDPNDTTVPAWVRSLVNPQYIQIPGVKSLANTVGPPTEQMPEGVVPGLSGTTQPALKLAEQAGIGTESGTLEILFNGLFPGDRPGNPFNYIAPTLDEYEEAKKAFEAGDPNALLIMKAKAAKVALGVSSALDKMRKATSSLFVPNPDYVVGSRGQQPYLVERPLTFSFREDGVYQNQNGSYVKSDVATQAYMKLRAVRGFSLEELGSMKTTDGVAIVPKSLDWTRDLIFRNRYDLTEAVKEYEQSGGKTGIIANWMNAMTSAGVAITDDKALIETQAQLIKMRGF